MVNTGDESTMLGQWRIVLRQAEESARAGRLDEALALAGRADVAEYRQAVALRGRLVLDLMGRATRRAEADDVAGAIADLETAQRHGAAPDALAAARLRLADLVADEVRSGLVAGDPTRVLERVDGLARHHISGPSLRRSREAAEAWQKALDELRRGEYGLAREALERAERLAGEAAAPALAACRREIDTRQKAAAPAVERLYEVLRGTDWSATLAAADAVLELIPEHAAAKQARARAWHQIAALSPAATLPRRAPSSSVLIIDEHTEPARKPLAPAEPPAAPPLVRRPAAPAPRPAPAPGERILLWADAVGGYLILMGDEIVLGRAGPDGQADVPLLGDLSRRHATLVRSGDGYLLRAHHPTFLNNRRVEAAPLSDGDVIRLGSTLELEFHQPSPISTTARLDFVSRHRLPVAVDGVILMAETCIVGPSRQAHIPAPNLEAPVVLYRQGQELWCKAPGEFEVDGRPRVGRSALSPRSNVMGEGFSFSLEPLGSRASHV
jgi:hypothetical protein